MSIENRSIFAVKLLSLFLALVTALGLAVCAGVSEASAPQMATSPITPIDETYMEVVEQFTFLPSFTGYTFPAGRYLPVKREHGGVFYESPVGIKVRTLGGSYVVKGGIFRGDPNARNESAVRVYAYMPAGGLQTVPLHSMIGLDLNKKMRCVPPLSF